MNKLSFLVFILSIGCVSKTKYNALQQRFDSMSHFHGITALGDGKVKGTWYGSGIWVEGLHEKWDSTVYHFGDSGRIVLTGTDGKTYIYTK
jgi:hypothetical protein